MKPDRFFYTGAGALFLLLTVLGFHQYIFAGKHVDGSAIEAPMVAAVEAHGVHAPPPSAPSSSTGPARSSS